MRTLYLDVHVLQAVPPSCINRDDTGSPKTAIYGGVTRARVSSQAWKRAMRCMFKDIFSQEQIGLRTKKVVELVAKELENLGYEGNTGKAATEALEKAGIKINKKAETDALLFMSRPQARALAKLCMDGETDKGAHVNALKGTPSIDIALFGRMVASEPSLNFDAAAQVAHSISTHEVKTEFDYFTAVDDMSQEDNMGAGHLGTVEFHSATLYRYATVNLRELKEQLGEDTAAAVKGFVKAFLLSMPTGKQNSFANRTVPDFAYITIRDDQPVNLAGAFEKPVYTRQDGYTEKSIAALKDCALNTYRTFVGAPVYACCIGREEEGLGETLSLPELMDTLEDKVCAWLKEDEK